MILITAHSKHPNDNFLMLDSISPYVIRRDGGLYACSYNPFYVFTTL